MWETLYMEALQASTHYSWRENVNVIFAHTRLPEKVTRLSLTEKSKNETKSQLSPE